MAHIIKKGPIKVPTQPKDFDLQATGLVFKSYDNQIALEFNVAQQDGTPADLLGANLRLLMFIYDEVDGTIKKEPIPFITKNLITESFLNGHVVYILPEAMKAYNGMVEAYVYIEYPDGSTSDNLGFTFRMKRSAIDGLAQDKADYFIEDFKQLLAAASLEANKVIEGLDTEIKNLQQATKDANAAVDGAMDRIDGLEAEIGQLERLREMYIDTLDFGGYDYSGNPNLMANINADSFSQGSGALSVVDDGDEVVITLDPNHKLEVLKPKSQPALLTGKTYTVSVEIMLEGDFTGDPSKIGLRYIKMPNWVSELYTRNTLTATKGVWQKLTGTVKITAASDNAESWLIMLQNKDANNSLSGKLRLRHAKLEEGSTATPYQPNLLAEPYNMCPEYPNENIVNPTVKFPIKTSNNPISGFDISEELIIGETYTVSLKGTKPANKEFHLYYGDANYQQSQSQYQATLLPVEGLANVWSATFTARNTSETTNLLRVALWQKPNSATYGTVQIDWLKIEKGDTRTPNISQFKYFGEGLKDSNNPNDYSWDITPEYTEKGLNNTVSLTEPQSVEGLKNFADGIQIAGDKVISENDCTVYTLTKDNSQSFIDGYVTFIKHGKEVIVNGTVKFKKAYAFGVPLDDEVPDEFIARIVHGMLTGQSGTNSVSKAMYVQKDLGKIMTNSEFAANEWFTFHGNYWVGVK
ncbi:TPA: BppU family phage baseplate upper protein [Enterococcus faecium]|nr:phage baseplate upper protein [Enterococcus faecium]MDT6397056.1 phage baseplate upper protein [Enterococcus faecium]HAQ6544892.1 BppU family phage baseplate upper protein [Enterococcus faecium]HAQ6609795.1 BppU family phage baseplate upper protein [Enterococcus faecium]HAQ6793033.1 BppU family phage baseplate upper protein [Enterococcus faecium]